MCYGPSAARIVLCGRRRAEGRGRIKNRLRLDRSSHEASISGLLVSRNKLRKKRILRGISVASLFVKTKRFVYPAFCRAEFAAYEAPRTIQFVADLPKTTTGKIVRRQLRKLDGFDVRSGAPARCRERADSSPSSPAWE